MMWHIQVLNTKGEVKQQIDYEGSEASARALSLRAHRNYVKKHPEKVVGRQIPVRGSRKMPKWQHNW